MIMNDHHASWSRYVPIPPKKRVTMGECGASATAKRHRRWAPR